MKRLVKNASLLSIIFLLTAVFFLSSLAFAADDADPDLAETMECQFTPELVALADELDRDPVKIYNWVYENIQFDQFDKDDLDNIISYKHSRLGAYGTYLRRRANQWDTCSLLITLLRISDIPAHYVSMGSVNQLYVEALLPTTHYRGQGSGVGEREGWLPLVPWYKELRIEDGIDLFPDGSVVAELDFDFARYLDNEDYLGDVEVEHKKTALELYEEKLQNYLATHYYGKTLKDIPFKETIIKRPLSILPGSLPIDMDVSDDKTIFSEINDADRANITLEFYKKDIDANGNEIETELLTKIIYLPEIVGKRFCLDFIPASDEDAQTISEHGGMCLTPAGAAMLKPVLKIDGKIITDPEDTASIATGEYFVTAYTVRDYDKLVCQKQKAGTFISMAFEPLAATAEVIEKLKKELEDVDIELTYEDGTREEFLGRLGNILGETYLLRYREAGERAARLLYGKLSAEICPTFIYTFADQFLADDESKYLIHPQWNIDSRTYANFYRRLNGDNVKIAWNDPMFKFCRSLYMYGTSYNEGIIFEDWQDTTGLSTIKGIMMAYEQGMDVVTLTSVSDLTAQFFDADANGVRTPLEAEAYQAVLEELQEGNTVTTPTQIITYVEDEGEDMCAYVMISVASDNVSYYFNLDNGGASSEYVIPETTHQEVTTGYFADGITSYENYEELSKDEVFVAVWGNTTREIVNAEVSKAGDPVDMVKGEFYQEEKPDIFIKSRGFDLEIKRKYKSQLIFKGPFGYGWAWNHAERILPEADGDIVYYNSDCVPYNLGFNGDGTYQSPPGTTFVLIKTGNTYMATLKSGIKYYFNSMGFLTRKEDRHGNELTFEYDENDQLVAIKDSLNRALILIYQNGKVVRVEDSSDPSQACAYSYGNADDPFGDSDDLRSFVDLEGNTTEYQYLKGQENPLNNHNMCKYILPKGDYLEIGYYKNDQVAYHTNAKGETFNFLCSRLNRYAETWNESGYYRKIFFSDTNDVIRYSNEDGTVETMDYDDNHNMVSHTDANGYTTTYTYDANRNMTSKSNALGETWTYVYDLTINKPLTITDPKQNVTVFVYDTQGKGNLLTMTDPLGKVTTFTYDDYGNNLSITDHLGYSTIKIYDANCVNVASITDKRGYGTTFTYDAAGNVLTKTDPAGYMTTFTYNKYNQKTAVIDALENVTAIDYDENRKLLRTVTADGAVTEHIYDTARDIVTGAKIIRTIDPLGGSEYYDYDEVGNLIRKTDRNGNVTRYFYDGMNRLVEESDPYQNSTRYAYDGNGNVVAKWDTRGNVTRFTYDAANRKTGVTDAEGNTTGYLYDANGNLTDEIKTLSDHTITTHFDYDGMNRLETRTLAYGTADARIYQYQYDALGRLRKAVEPKGNYLKYEYDENGNRVKEESFDSLDAKQYEKIYHYNSRNLLDYEIDANGKTYAAEYDALGRKTAVIDPLGNRVDYVYDSVGSLIMVMDQGGGATEHYYDRAARLIKTVDAMGQTTACRYDANGNRTAEIDPRGNETLTYYDALNRKIGLEDALGNVTTYDYDPNGNLVRSTDALGSTVSFDYDGNNRVTRKIDPLGYETVTEYDALDRVIKNIDAKGAETHYAYNDFGEKIQEMKAYGTSDEAVIQYDYDANGNLETITSAGNGVITYGYDALNRRIQEWDHDNSLLQVQYDGNGNIVQELHRDGVTITREYDALNRLETIKKSGVAVQTFQYDSLSRMTGATDANEGRQTHTVAFEYDPLHRVIAETQDG
ncbi:MAG: DUF6531 domain-containing protein, partial [Syntrophales bacterium]|nr:DUF6531 domain-containing protein [Syntrophales bacterium]